MAAKAAKQKVSGAGAKASFPKRPQKIEKGEVAGKGASYSLKQTVSVGNNSNKTNKLNKSNKLKAEKRSASPSPLQKVSKDLKKEIKKNKSPQPKRSTLPQDEKFRSSDLKEVIHFVEELKKQWMATVDALIDPLMMVNTDFEILKANRALWQETAFPSVRAVIGKKCYKVFAKRSSPCSGCAMLKAAQKGAAEQSLLNDLDEKYYEVSSQPVYNHDKSLEGVLQVYRDRTESKRLQEKLAQSDKLASIGHLAGGVAHELNNPLGGILVFSQMLLKEMPEDSPFHQDLKEIEMAALRCRDIVEDLLEFAHVSPSLGKRFSKPLEKVNIVHAIRQALNFARVGGRLRQRKHIIKDLLGDEGPEVLGQKNKLIQVFLNLIQNALDAMPKGGTLTLNRVTGKNDAHHFVCSVKDTGIGMTKEELSKAFDPFFTTKDPGKGTGLGLAICFSTIEDFGGEIEIVSAPGKGTQVKVRLTLA